MEAFFSTLAQYVDFLVLGFVAVPILTAPFDFEPLLLGWSSLHHAAPDNNYFRHLLIGGVFFAVSYFSGYALIAIGHQLVQDAHVQIVYEAQKPFDKDIAIPQPDWRFKLRAIPFFGAPLGPSEITAYRDDARYQVYWIICDNTSYENVLAGPTLKEQRLLIGAAAIAEALFISGIAGFIASFFLPADGGKAPITDSKKSFSIGIRRRRRKWSLVAIVAGPFFLFGIILPAYWAAEFEIHSSIWAIFPQPIKSDVAFTFKEAVDCHQLMIAAPNAASRPTK